MRLYDTVDDSHYGYVSMALEPYAIMDDNNPPAVRLLSGFNIMRNNNEL